MAKKAKSRKDDPPATFARVDADGVLREYVTIPRSQAPAGALEVPADCDLALGRYRWNEGAQRFDPIDPPDALAPNLATDTLRAIWKGFVSLQEAGHELPDETLQWMAAYRKTIDAKG